jgi:hypothetical protein
MDVGVSGREVEEERGEYGLLRVGGNDGGSGCKPVNTSTQTIKNIQTKRSGGQGR